ncbi:MAG TPA: hypothetical protein VLB80_02255, partial [Candidatus Babeliales bacterium]|nr:hypothetical protein [Candidatus Babeliales bacterium]
RKLFWGAIGLAGTVAGGMVGKKYLPSQTQTQKKIDVKDLAFIVGEDISSAAKQVANKWKQSTKEALDRDRLTEAEKFVGGPISKKLREGGASASKKLKEVGVSTSKILKEGAESLLEASRKNPQQEEYFEKEYGPQSTEAIKKLPQDIKSGLTSLRESTREYPAEFEGEEGNYLTSKYGPVVRENAEQAVKKVSQKVSEGRQQVGKFISDTSQAAQESSIGQAISKGLEEGKEFLNKTFGKYFESEVPAVEENSKVEEGL